MIFGIGHDIVEIDRIKKLLDQYGDVFIKKILSLDEIDIYINSNKDVHYLAKRFAAKEAFAKACGTGLRYPILLPSISIINDSLGKPEFKFNSDIMSWLTQYDINHHHLSISDEKTMASAFVILEH
jgi:holo-[acyl-carrier protein] synthase